MNLGKCAGAGIDQHLHLHVVPRWCGDANFMTISGETRVLPEALHTTYIKLKPFFQFPTTGLTGDSASTHGPRSNLASFFKLTTSH